MCPSYIMLYHPAIQTAYCYSPLSSLQGPHVRTSEAVPYTLSHTMKVYAFLMSMVHEAS